jgi:hypothetical protein
VFVGLVLGCGCAAISAFVHRVQLATVLGYGLALTLLLGTVLVQLAVNVIDESRGTDEGDAPAWILLPNPFATVTSGVADGPVDPGSMSTPFDWFERLFVSGDDGCESFFVDEFGQELCDETGEPLRAQSEFPKAFWWQSLLVLSVVAVGAVALGSRRLRTPAAVER